jgi:hypothetical protein
MIYQSQTFSARSCGKSLSYLFLLALGNVQALAANAGVALVRSMWEIPVPSQRKGPYVDAKNHEG